MPFGTPGADVQPQAMLQFVLNIVEFGMNPQEAAEAPRLASYSMPLTGDPHPYRPNLLRLEARDRSPSAFPRLRRAPAGSGFCRLGAAALASGTWQWKKAARL